MNKSTGTTAQVIATIKPITILFLGITGSNTSMIIIEVH